MLESFVCSWRSAFYSGEAQRGAIERGARDPSPSWHRRERRKRSEARTLLRLESARALLQRHHSSFCGDMAWQT